MFFAYPEKGLDMISGCRNTMDNRRGNVAGKEWRVPCQRFLIRSEKHPIHHETEI